MCNSWIVYYQEGSRQPQYIGFYSKKKNAMIAMEGIVELKKRQITADIDWSPGCSVIRDMLKQVKWHKIHDGYKWNTETWQVAKVGGKNG